MLCCRYTVILTFRHRLIAELKTTIVYRINLDTFDKLTYMGIWKCVVFNYSNVVFYTFDVDITPFTHL